MSDPDQLAGLVYRTYHRVSPRERSYPDCHWVMNAGLFKAISMLRDSHGNPLVFETLDPTVPWYLLDQPVEIDESAEGLRLIPGQASHRRAGNARSRDDPA